MGEFRQNCKPENYRRLMEVDGDAKTVKGSAYGYQTGIMYLAPADSSGVVNVCGFANRCKKPCLNTSGLAGVFPSIIQARIEKTRYMVADPVAFFESLCYDVERLDRQAERRGLIPVYRTNGTSDQPKWAMRLAARYPNRQFYDYTKIPKPWKRVRPNYHLTFSLDSVDTNLADAMESLEHGINVAVVFDTKRGRELPLTWRGWPVIDGDVSDLRFLDESPRIVGLRAKGKARGDESGFVQIAV